MQSWVLRSHLQHRCSLTFTSSPQRRSRGGQVCFPQREKEESERQQTLAPPALHTCQNWQAVYSTAELNLPNLYFANSRAPGAPPRWQHQHARARLGERERGCSLAVARLDQPLLLLLHGLHLADVARFVLR